MLVCYLKKLGDSSSQSMGRDPKVGCKWSKSGCRQSGSNLPKIKFCFETNSEATWGLARQIITFG